MTNETVLAIVPAEETALDKPRHWFQRQPKPVPMKERHYADVTQAITPYRDPADLTAAHQCLTSEDLSDHRILRTSDIENAEAAMVAGGLILILGIGFLVGGEVGSLFSVYPAAFVAVIGKVSGLWDRCSRSVRKNRVLRLLSGRTSETEEISAGAKRLAATVIGDAAPGSEPIRLPVESLFRCLGHDDTRVQRVAAALISQLPQEVRMAGIAAFSKYLRVEQLQLLPGMENITPEMAAAGGIDTQYWPEKLDAMTFV